VRYRPNAEVRILRGENAGRTLTYSNIVIGWTDLREWDGRSELSLEVSISGAEPAVILVQEAGHGAILGAAEAR
jgi:hypothetical protein